LIDCWSVGLLRGRYEKSHDTAWAATKRRGLHRYLRRRRVACFATVLLGGSVCLPSAGSSQPLPGAPTPVLGVTYTHTLIGSDCSLLGGIVRTYDQRGVRRLVRTQLAAMRAAGIQSIRTILWHMADASNQDWGVVSSGGGRLYEPFRSNLLRFVSDIRAAGFSRLTIDFGPQWTNNPVGEYGPTGLTADRWDPSKLEENWSFVADVHRLVQGFGPDSTVFDFLGEMPPTHYQPAYIVDRMQSYIATLWARYVDTFGKGDATISVISSGDSPDRLQHLIDAIRLSKRPFPDWIELHLDWTSPSAYNALEQAAQTLDANGLTTEPISVGEASYDNPSTAADIARFIRGSTTHPVLEVFEWWQRDQGGPCYSAPYRSDAYLAALTGAAVPPPTPSPLPLMPIPVLHARVTPSGAASLRDSAGQPIRTLDAGEYTVIVSDESRRFGFRLADPDGSVVRTTTSFTGSKTWALDLGITSPYGSRLTYGSERAGSRRAVVLH
jgi:hypothetical protein